VKKVARMGTLSQLVMSASQVNTGPAACWETDVAGHGRCAIHSAEGMESTMIPLKTNIQWRSV
jgi:hypothetical protein